MAESIEKMEPVGANALEAIERASIDIQIATAKKYPRDLQKFVKAAINYATFDEETAESCIYRRPVGKVNGKQTFAEGLSIRLAEIVGATYNNLRFGGMITEQTERKTTARGFAFDLENNTAMFVDVVESTVKRDGSPYDERMRVVIAKAAVSKALRDAIFRIVPRSLVKPVENEVRNVLFGSKAPLDERRKRAIGWVSKLGISTDRIWKALDISDPAMMTGENLEMLAGIKTAIQSSEISIDEAFPAIVTPPDTGGVRSAFDALKPKAESTAADDTQTVEELANATGPAPGPLEPATPQQVQMIKDRASDRGIDDEQLNALIRRTVERNSLGDVRRGNVVAVIEAINEWQPTAGESTDNDPHGEMQKRKPEAKEPPKREPDPDMDSPATEEQLAIIRKLQLKAGLDDAALGEILNDDLGIGVDLTMITRKDAVQIVEYLNAMTVR